MGAMPACALPDAGAALCCAAPCPTAPLTPPSLMWTTLAPAVFVLLWSTGFIFAKMGLPYAEPFTFVALRYAAVVALMLPVALAAARVVAGSRPVDIAHLVVAGLLLHAVYIGGVFASIYHGLPAGISALIVGLQPVLTATLVGPFLGERVTARQWLGLLLGLVGVALVLGDKLAFDRATGGAVALAVLALVGITLGTIYQKRFCTTADMRSSAVIQFAAAGLACLAVALPLETMRVEWSRRIRLRTRLAGARAVDRHGQPALPSAAARCRSQDGKPVLPCAAGYRAVRLGAFRRDAGHAGASRHGAGRGRCGAGTTELTTGTIRRKCGVRTQAIFKSTTPHWIR